MEFGRDGRGCPDAESLVRPAAANPQRRQSCDAVTVPRISSLTEHDIRNASSQQVTKLPYLKSCFFVVGGERNCCDVMCIELLPSSIRDRGIEREKSDCTHTASPHRDSIEHDGSSALFIPAMTTYEAFQRAWPTHSPKDPLPQVLSKFPSELWRIQKFSTRQSRSSAARLADCKSRI